MAVPTLPSNATRREKAEYNFILLTGVVVMAVGAIFAGVGIAHQTDVASAQRTGAFQGGLYSDCRPDSRKLENGNDVVVNAIACDLVGKAGQTQQAGTRIKWNGVWYSNCEALPGSSRDAQSPPPAIRCFQEN